MTRAIFVRHGESVSNAHPERAALPLEEGDELTDLGRSQSRAAGEALGAHEPTALLSSPMGRARQTAVLIKKAAKIAGNIEYDERIYEASPHRLLKVVSELDENLESAMLVGHNPGLEGLIKILTGEVQPMPTAALAVIDFDAENWTEIAPESADADPPPGVGSAEEKASRRLVTVRSMSAMDVDSFAAFEDAGD